MTQHSCENVDIFAHSSAGGGKKESILFHVWLPTVIPLLTISDQKHLTTSWWNFWNLILTHKKNIQQARSPFHIAFLSALVDVVYSQGCVLTVTSEISCIPSLLALLVADKAGMVRTVIQRGMWRWRKANSGNGASSNPPCRQISKRKERKLAATHTDTQKQPPAIVWND